MYKIKIIGAGSLGSGLALELSRRAAATQFPLQIDVFDDDEVEERNVFSQDFFPSDIGKKKADAICERCSQYSYVEVKSYPLRVTESNLHLLELTEDTTIIMDCVDNLATRQMLWMAGESSQTPVIHVAMTNTGQGQITWNYQGHDTFPLSPINLHPDLMAAVLGLQEEKKPPCELNSFRPLILNTYMAAVNALFIFLGKDITKEIMTEEGEVLEIKGLSSTWITTHRSMELQKHTLKPLIFNEGAVVSEESEEAGDTE